MTLPEFQYENYSPVDDVYETRIFKIHVTGGNFINLMVDGVQAGDHAAWATFYDKDLDELITALSYYREYRTFKPKEA